MPPSEIHTSVSVQGKSIHLIRRIPSLASVILTSFLGRRLFCLGVVYAFLCGPAYAIQSHPAPEGLYVHQLAHVCFIVSMAVLAYWLEVHQFCRQKGWRYIQIAALLFVLWNMAAFAGHWIEEKIPRELFVGDPDWSQRLIAGDNVWADLFYILKLDHLISVPAIVCLYYGIKLLYRDLEKGGDAP